MSATAEVSWNHLDSETRKKLDQEYLEELADWLASDPERNEESGKKFEAMNQKIQELKEVLTKY